MAYIWKGAYFSQNIQQIKVVPWKGNFSQADTQKGMCVFFFFLFFFIIIFFSFSA